MKLLLENWRQYLNEGIKTLETLPEDYFIKISRTGDFSSTHDGYELRLLQLSKEGKLLDDLGTGYVVTAFDVADLNPRQEGESDCDHDGFDTRLFEDLYTLHLYFENVKGQGYGPLIADIAMEIAYQEGRMIIPPKLVGGEITPRAQKLFDFYYTKRGDVEIVPFSIHCWEEYSGWDYSDDEGYDDLPESFLALYSKATDILKSPMAKKKIIWEDN